MGKRPTIQMVAELSGVSRGTVDRVINNRSYVKAEVRERVLAAIEELGYGMPREGLTAVLPVEPVEALHLGVVLPNWVGHTRMEMMRGIEAARSDLARYRVEVLIAECQTDIPAEVIERIDGLVAAGAKGIAICAIADPAIENRIDQLAEAGIPVITFNSDLPDSRRLCFIGQDYNKSGRIAAEMMSKCIPQNGKILAVAGNLEFNGHRKRLDGFCTRMRELGFSSGQIEVIETYNDYHVTRRKVAEVLSQNPRLSAVYMANQSVAGCADAVKEAGKAGSLRIICHDVSENTKKLMLERRVDLTISQDIFNQGYQPLVLLQGLLQRGIDPTTVERSASGIDIVCAESL
ncbi:MAG: substrate-binding domain-containing protein [Butyricicoccus sp.]|nr:substrate-binding domain-containing protein [Butyricicoccus sp.]MBQ8585528.1 substrate-binding domain-containing protein [Butyricicoccus sp.]